MALMTDLSKSAVVMPAQAGIHVFLPTKVVDARLRGHDHCARTSHRGRPLALALTRPAPLVHLS